MGNCLQQAHVVAIGAAGDSHHALAERIHTGVNERIAPSAERVRV